MSNYEFWDELGRIFNAVVAYQEKSIEFNKRFINPWISLGNVFDKQDRHREAVSAYQKAVEIDPASAQNWCDLGNAYFRTEAYDQAIHAFKQAIELNPQFGWPYSNLALIYGTRGDHDQAILLYKTSISLLQDNKDKAVSWNRLGNLYRKLNEYDLAVQAFQKADELDHENAGFRDVLDEVPASALSASADAQEGSDQSLERFANPIQLIVEESQAEEAALSAISSELEAAPAIDEVLAGEGGDDLPEAAVDAAPGSVDAAQVDLLDPVQGPDQLGRLPEDLVLELETEAPAVAAESVAEAVVAPVRETAEPLVEAESEAAEVVQEVVATFTETLTVTGQMTNTSEMPVAAAVGESEIPAAIEEETTAVAEKLEAADPAQDAPVETLEPVTASMDVVAEASFEPGTTAEAKIDAVTAPVETPELATVAVIEPVVTAEAITEIAAEVPETVEIAAGLASQVVETETILEPALIAVAEETVSSDAVTPEAPQAEPVAEESEDDTEILQHAAYEEFLKDDGKVLNTLPVTPKEAPLPIPISTVSAEPATRIDATGEFQIAMDTKNAHVWNELGNVYFNNGAIDDSIVAYSKAIELDRWFAWPYSNLALAYVQKDRFAEAVLLYQRSIELFQSEKDKAVSWNRLGNVYRRMNDYDSAIAAYQTADELDPDNTTLSLQSRFSLLGSYQVEQSASLLA